MEILTCHDRNEHDLLKLENLTKRLRLKHQISVPNLPIATKGLQAPADKSNAPALALKRATTVVRFIVRLQIAAREWRKQEELRKVLVTKWDEYEKRSVGVVGGKIKKPAPAFTPATALGGAGSKKPIAASTAATTATTTSSRFPAFVNDIGKRKRNDEDSELDEVESSAAPLEFDVDSSSREREERMAQAFGELEGTEAFSVDSL